MLTNRLASLDPRPDGKSPTCEYGAHQNFFVRWVKTNRVKMWWVKMRMVIIMRS